MHTFLATALLFAKNGYKLSLSGRNEPALAAVVHECIKLGLSEEMVSALDHRRSSFLVPEGLNLKTHFSGLQ